MHYSLLGNSGLEVSSLCLGTMTFGRESDRAGSKAVFEKAYEAGINFFDCADVYSGGEAERLLGEFASGKREELVITTKTGFPFGDKGKNNRGLSRKHMIESVDGSLRRLKTDYIDVFFTHYLDPNIPIEEICRTMDDLVSSGKVRTFGVSNWCAWQIAKALGISFFRGWNRITCIEPMYNLVKRQAEVELLPLALSENLGVICYSPLGGGLLTGKHTFDQRHENSRLASQDLYKKRYGHEWMYQAAAGLSKIAEERGVSAVTLAIAWVLKHQAVTAPIIGARNLEQLQPALDAATFNMDDALYAQITELTPDPPSATDRNP